MAPSTGGTHIVSIPPTLDSHHMFVLLCVHHSMKALEQSHDLLLKSRQFDFMHATTRLLKRNPNCECDSSRSRYVALEEAGVKRNIVNSTFEEEP